MYFRNNANSIALKMIITNILYCDCIVHIIYYRVHEKIRVHLKLWLKFSKRLRYIIY